MGLVNAVARACHTGIVQPYVIGYIVLGVVAVVAVVIANQVGRRAGRRSLQQRLTALRAGLAGARVAVFAPTWPQADAVDTARFARLQFLLALLVADGASRPTWEKGDFFERFVPPSRPARR